MQPILCAAVPVLLLATAAAAQPPPPEGEAAARLEPSTIEKLNRLKLSGYVQGRYEYHEDANYGLDPVRGTPRGTSRFMVRRARFKAAYAAPYSEYVLQLAANPGEAVGVTDAEATFVEPWTPLKLRLTMGQFKLPFGFEVLQSSSERELPERVTAVRALFPGERDRGLRLTGRWRVMQFWAALINGNGTRDPIYGAFDQTSFKDLVGRVAAALGPVSLGGSAYWGHTLVTTLGRPATGTMPATATSYDRFRRLRLGADAQARAAVPRVGVLEVRGELFWSDDHNIEFSGVPGNPCKDVRALGWYATVVQRIGTLGGAAVRVDQYDPRATVEAGCPGHEASRTDRLTAVGGAVFLDAFPNLRVTLAYEHRIEQEPARRDDDVFTAQLQARF